MKERFVWENEKCFRGQWSKDKKEKKDEEVFFRVHIHCILLKLNLTSMHKCTENTLNNDQSTIWWYISHFENRE